MTDGAIQVILTASSDLSIRIFGAKDGINPRILRGHTRAITCLHILGIGKQVLSGSKDGTVRLWDVGSGKEVGKWDMEGRKGVEGMVVVDDERGLRELGLRWIRTGARGPRHGPHQWSHRHTPTLLVLPNKGELGFANPFTAE
jgi:hypothetical protein